MEDSGRLEVETFILNANMSQLGSYGEAVFHGHCKAHGIEITPLLIRLAFNCQHDGGAYLNVRFRISERQGDFAGAGRGILLVEIEKTPSASGDRSTSRLSASA